MAAIRRPPAVRITLRLVSAQTSRTGARIATVIGRYYAMDRDQRWERNKLAWDAIVLGRGAQSDLAPAAAVAEAYTHEPRGDEFLEPIIFSHANEQRVRDGDVVIWFNFRADRARQLSIAFLDKDFKGFDREVLPIVHYVTLTEYDKTYGCPVVFGPQSLAQYPRRSGEQGGPCPAPHRGDRKIPARHLFLQRRS